MLLGWVGRWVGGSVGVSGVGVQVSPWSSTYIHTPIFMSYRCMYIFFRIGACVFPQRHITVWLTDWCLGSWTW